MILKEIIITISIVNCGDKNKMRNKKAQLKIQQMAFMLIATTIFFALVGMFVLVFKFSGISESANLAEEKNAILLAEKLANSPEFSCGESFGTKKTNCVDFDKVIMLKENIYKYDRFWGVSNIEIRRIYPKTNGEIKCTRGNYPNCNVLRLISDEQIGADASTFVTLCRKESVEGLQGESYDKCELAKLIISYEKQSF